MKTQKEKPKIITTKLNQEKNMEKNDKLLLKQRTR